MAFTLFAAAHLSFIRNIKRSWWKRYSRWYDAIWDSPWTDFVSNKIVSALKSVNAKCAIEIGCGTGLITRHLAENGLNVTGIDISEDMLERARVRCVKSDFIQADAVELRLIALPLCNAIVAANLFHLCDDINTVIENIAEKTRNDSAIAVFTWPTDALSMNKMFVTDLRHGRGLLDCMKAYLLRWLIGLTGAPLRIRRNKHRDIMNAFIGAGLIITQDEIIDLTLHMVICCAVFT
jgi:SAM-dependent methyltransferase